MGSGDADGSRGDERDADRGGDRRNVSTGEAGGDDEGDDADSEDEDDDPGDTGAGVAGAGVRGLKSSSLLTKELRGEGAI